MPKELLNIKQEILAWNGKSTDDIRAIYDRYSHASSFVSEILRLAREEALQRGATWLLKHHLEVTGCLKLHAAREVFLLLPKLEHWETKLHVLQCIPHVPILKTHKTMVETFLRKCLLEDAKFVRAWAYSGFYELAVQYPEYQAEAKQLFEKAMNNEVSSVKARIRNIIKRGF